MFEHLREPVGVELAGSDGGGVTARLRRQNFRAECFAEPRDVSVQRVPRRVGWSLAPDLVDDAVGGDDVVRIQEQEGEQGTRLPTRQVEPLSVLPCFERPQDPEVQPPLPPSPLLRNE